MTKLPALSKTLGRNIKSKLGDGLLVLIPAVGKNIRSKLGAGLLVFIPVAITFIAVRYVLTALDDLFYPDRLAAIVGYDFLGLGVVLLLLLLYVIGVLATSKRGSRVPNIVEAVTERIPVIRTIYLATREATKLFSRGKDQEYRRVVLLEFPRPGVKAVGLVTASFSNPQGESQLAIYIPTTPNPTSGQLAIVPEHEVEDAGISVEQALRIIISGGILVPSMMGTALEAPQKEGTRH